MQFEELRYICQEAAVDLMGREERPLTPHVVLPGPERTRLVRLPGFPEDDEARHELVAQLASDEVVPGQVPCWGFVAEAEIDDDPAVVVVYGARRHPPHLTASRIDEDGQLEEFVPSEELDPTAMPFLHPLQHAVDQLEPLDEGGGGLPMFE